MSDVPPCQCSEPGFCPRYQREMQGRLHELCSMKARPEYPVTPAQSERYRRHWDAETAQQQITASAPEAPGLLDKAASVGEAYARWLAAGRPKRSDAEVEQCLAACRSCADFVDGSCKHCGCPMEGDFLGLTGLRAKASMATEDCPYPGGSRWVKALPVVASKCGGCGSGKAA